MLRHSEDQRSLYACSFIGVVTLLCVIAFGTTSAVAHSPTLPAFNGMTVFPTIHGPTEPEEYSWEVMLDGEQTLRSVDEQSAEVYNTSNDFRAFVITAMAAHDAVGSTVPTSLAVSGGNVITLTVHHQVGNPAASGASFDYPIIAGEGWEGGFTTVQVVMPPAEPVGSAEPFLAKHCLVPRLKGRTLRGSKKQLLKANCEIGSVRKLKGATAKTGMVVKQHPRPGRALAPGTAVGVTLGA